MSEYDQLEFQKQVILDGKVARALRSVEDDYVAWMRFRDGRLSLCDSNTEGAFCVYRMRSIEKALRKILDDL